MGKALETAEWLANLRLSRAETFDKIMFAEPGWDIILALFIHEERHGSSVPIRDLPALTGYNSAILSRWISLFLLADLVRLDSDDRFVSLTVEAVDKVRSILM